MLTEIEWNTVANFRIKRMMILSINFVQQEEYEGNMLDYNWTCK